MNYRRLGSAGLKVSELSYGAWVSFKTQMGGDTAYDCMKAAYEAGVNFFDNAESYAGGEAEVLMGEAFRRAGWRRASYIVSTKFYWGLNEGPNEKNTLNRKYLMQAMDGSLKRFGMDYVDLIFCHRPDPNTPIEETVRAMHDLVSQGKVLYWGTSEWSGQQITEAYGVARELRITPPTMEQPQYNFFERDKVERDYLPVYSLAGIGTTIWSPLASGVLTGKYNKGIPVDSRLNLPGYEWLKAEWESAGGKAKLAKVEKLAALAEKSGLPIHHMALLWCLSNPHVSTVILGASKESQLKDNLAALESRHLMTDALKDKIEKILLNKPEAPRRY